MKAGRAQAICGLVSLLACWCLTGDAIAAGPATRPTLTRHDEFRAMLSFNRHTLVDAYDADGAHDAKWDADAHAFFERLAIRVSVPGSHRCYDIATDTSNAAMLKLVQKLERCDDPLVSYWRAVIYKDAGQQDDYSNLMSRAAPRVVAGHYPAYRRFWAANALVRLRPTDPRVIEQRDALLAPMLFESGNDPWVVRDLRTAVTDVVWRTSSANAADHAAPATRQKLLDTLAANPHTDPWLLTMLDGDHEIAAAWEARGNGFANQVTKQGWAGFEQHIAAAADAYKAAYKIDPMRPESCEGMIIVCKARGDAFAGRQWFNRGTAAQIDYRPLWTNYAALLEPRWGGSLEQMQALARSAVDCGRFDTQTPWFLFDVLNDMREQTDDPDAIYKRPGIWAAINKLYDGCLIPLAKWADVVDLKSYRAAFAYRCGEYAQTQQDLKDLGGRVEEQAFTANRLDRTAVIEECAARTGKAREAITLAESREMAGDFAAAASQFNAAAVTAGDAGASFCRRRAAMAEMEQALSRGESVHVPLETPDVLRAWTGNDGSWHVADGVLTCRSTSTASTSLNLPLSTPAKLRMTVEWSFDGSGPPPNLELDLQRTSTTGLTTLCCNPTYNAVLIKSATGGPFIGLAQAPAVPIKLIPGEWHTVSIDHDGAHVVVNCDGRQVLDVRDDRLSDGKSLLSIGEAAGGPEGAALKVRTLTLDPLR